MQFTATTVAALLALAGSAVARPQPMPNNGGNGGNNNNNDSGDVNFNQNNNANENLSEGYTNNSGFCYYDFASASLLPFATTTFDAATLARRQAALARRSMFVKRNGVAGKINPFNQQIDQSHPKYQDNNNKYHSTKVEDSYNQDSYNKEHKNEHYDQYNTQYEQTHNNVHKDSHDQYAQQNDHYEHQPECYGEECSHHYRREVASEDGSMPRQQNNFKPYSNNNIAQVKPNSASNLKTGNPAHSSFKGYGYEQPEADAAASANNSPTSVHQSQMQDKTYEDNNGCSGGSCHPRENDMMGDMGMGDRGMNAGNFKVGGSIGSFGGDRHDNHRNSKRCSGGKCGSGPLDTEHIHLNQKIETALNQNGNQNAGKDITSDDALNNGPIAYDSLNESTDDSYNDILSDNAVAIDDLQSKNANYAEPAYNSGPVYDAPTMPASVPASIPASYNTGYSQPALNGYTAPAQPVGYPSGGNSNSAAAAAAADASSESDSTSNSILDNDTNVSNDIHVPISLDISQEQSQTQQKVKTCETECCEPECVAAPVPVAPVAPCTTCVVEDEQPAGDVIAAAGSNIQGSGSSHGSHHHRKRDFPGTMGGAMGALGGGDVNFNQNQNANENLGEGFFSGMGGFPGGFGGDYGFGGGVVPCFFGGDGYEFDAAYSAAEELDLE